MSVEVYIPLMRTLGALLISSAATATAVAQSPSRDWRPEDRTVIGDFCRITSIASSIDRVYVSSPTSIVIWQPQFRTWSGPFEPPNRAALAGVFAALIDPLDQSLWLARSNGWVHYQPELQIWDEGAVPDAVVTIAFDETDPVSGLYIRARGGWLLLPRGRPRGRSDRSASRRLSSGTRRCRPTPRNSCSTPGCVRCGSPRPHDRST